MKRSLFVKSVLLVAGLSLMGAGCVYRERTVYQAPPPPPPGAVAPAGPEVAVTGPPPPDIVESVTVAPAPGFVWVAGAWTWGGRWIWAPGHWDRPPRRDAIWIGPHYVFRGGRHVWVRGYWR